MFARLRMGAGAVKREMESVCRARSAATSIDKKAANRKLDSTRTDSVRVESVLSMFWGYILFHRAHGALILEVYAGTFVLDVASGPGFALATRARASPLGQALHWPHGPKQIQGHAGLHFQC